MAIIKIVSRLELEWAILETLDPYGVAEHWLTRLCLWRPLDFIVASCHSHKRQSVRCFHQVSVNASLPIPTFHRSTKHEDVAGYKVARENKVVWTCSYWPYERLRTQILLITWNFANYYLSYTQTAYCISRSSQSSRNKVEESINSEWICFWKNFSGAGRDIRETQKHVIVACKTERR